MIIEDKILDRILAGVQKPARYTGGEFNSVVKPWESIKTRVALAFPDIYDLGMSNMGLALLYDTVNRQTDALAERVYLPWVDMEAAMRAAQIPLYSLETRHALTDFDIIGISLPYEQLFSNVLSVLDLAQIPLLSQDRDARYPLILGGGTGAFNPEPMADFFDCFAIGEGEEVLLEIIAAWETVKSADRPAQLRRLAQIPGVYVPQFYTPRYHPDGTLLGTEPNQPEAPAQITKRISPTLPPPVTKFVLPHTGVVFNRAAIEIQRGCTRGCRFCHAGMTSRPVRERPLEELLSAIEAIARETGHEELSLLSLSSSDYTHIEPLVKAISGVYNPQAFNISLPSLRIDSLSADLVDMLSGGRKNSFTFAPEAGTDRMRDVINKQISTEALLETADEVYKRGWRLIKLYFMIGQPTETDEDVIAIATLAKRVLKIGEHYHRRKAQVKIGVSTFVPKPHTPFQWAGMCSPEEVKRKQMLILAELKGAGGVIFNWNNPQETLLEASLSRGDRRLGAVIKLAWQNGVKFDAWSDQFKPEVWWQAFADCGLSPAWYAQRSRPTDEAFPWDHINPGPGKEWLRQDWSAAQRGETKIDCRDHCYHCGILTAYKNIRAEVPAQVWKCPPAGSSRRQKSASPQAAEG